MAQLIEIALVALGVYTLLGGVFAALFALWGVDRVDANAGASSWSFRVVILPGCAALWPLLAYKWLRAGRAKP